MKKGFVVFLVVAAILAGSSAVMAQTPGFGFLFYDGGVVRTVVPPATMSQPGRDNFYVVIPPVVGQLGIAAVAPGDKGYHGGKWAFHSVMWNVAPYPLMSEVDVEAAEDLEHVTVMRLPDMDFKCPIQP